MTDTADNLGRFLDYAPLGFAALILIAAIAALVAGRDNPMLRLILGIGFAVFCVSSVLATAPKYLAETPYVINTELALQLRFAQKHNREATTLVREMTGMVSGSCRGSPLGTDPDNYAAVSKKAQDANALLGSVGEVLSAAVSRGPQLPPLF